MNAHDRAMLHLEEAKYHFNKACKIITELAQDLNHARLRRTPDPVGQVEKTDSPSGVSTRLENGERVEPDGADRAKIVDIELRRARARAGIPNELRDII